MYDPLHPYPMDPMVPYHPHGHCIIHASAARCGLAGAVMSARTEYLVYFPDTPCYDAGRFIGVMPQHYVLCTDFDRKHAIANGGRDVSDCDGHWREWERQERIERGFA